ncbi:MAG: putative beta-lactamase-inhibitor-like, PepSY-like [Flavipsychrobacter sp.]|jgi:hypothetical protein|nr:putative beta-lactamase-inhibitor-like, PepSY-like [Flavipsychrobacter sp.]
MKKTIVYMALFVAGLSFTACKENKTETDITEADVPVAVKDAFTAKYPAAAEVKWEKETEGAKVCYEAEFKVENKEKEAFFDEAGAFIKEE